MIYEYNIISDENGKIGLVIEDEIVEEFKEIDEDVIALYLARQKRMDTLAVEVEYVVAIREEEVVGIYQLSKGTSNSTTLPLRELASFLLLMGADSFMNFHNHPSGTLEVSKDDQINNINLKMIIQSLGLELVGDYIISRVGFRSVDGDDVYEWNEDDY